MISAPDKEKFDKEELEKALIEPLDYTTTETVETLVKVNSMFSAAAKSAAGYRCELEGVNSCRYFTDKTSGKPYLEVHQIIPREYAGEFGVNIERASNYVALCPHCHRRIAFRNLRHRAEKTQAGAKRFQQAFARSGATQTRRRQEPCQAQTRQKIH